MEQGVANLRSSMGPTTRTERFACLHIFRALVTRFGRFASMRISILQVTGSIQMEFHDSNNKARNALFSCLSLGEFERVGHLSMAQ
jgi:hypothetical protein